MALNYIKSIINRNKRGNIGIKKLIILDDLFPAGSPASFRQAEYNYYLKNIENSEIYSTIHGFRNAKKKYVKDFPAFKNRVMRYKSRRHYPASLFYTIFLNNAYYFISTMEKEGVPFIFTLYPGGGFELDCKKSDEKLRRVFSSKYFQKVIVTHKITLDYLLRKQFCSPDQMKFIYGGLNPLEFFTQKSNKKFYKHEKETFDICFVANKYMEKGLDKGYDIFIEVAKSLSKLSPDIRFHVVGGFGKDEIDVSDIKDKINFYGRRGIDFFLNFYQGMDIILAPHRSFVLFPGGFDGFPSGCCTQAGLSGVAVLRTDALKMNVKFTDGKEICIIPEKIEEIVAIIMKYFSNPDLLYKLSRAGQKKFLQVFNYNEQMGKRMQIIEKYL